VSHRIEHIRGPHEGRGRCGPDEVRCTHGGFGHGRGMFGPHGHGFGPSRRTRRGDIRAAVLSVLAEEPMHGYQIMQQLEERSGGLWRPSPGSIYPTLQLLEDQGLVRSETVEGRRVFSLTDEGKAEAAASKERSAAPPWAADAEGADEPRFKLRQAFFQLGAATRQIGMTGSQEQVEKALQILADARRKLYGLLAEGE